MSATGIVWTDRVWNPTTGCDKVSPGCDHCYALTMAKRLKAMGQAKYQTDGDPRTSGPGFGVAEHRKALSIPLGWRKPSQVFVNSMSDLFHPRVSDEFIAKVFAVMAVTPRHTYQVLTKRPPRMRSLLTSHAWWTRFAIEFVGLRRDETVPTSYVAGPPSPYLSNVHLGISAETQEWADRRIPDLIRTPAAVRWVSAEPLLGPIDLTDWLADECGECQGVGEMADGGTCLACRGTERREGISWVVTGGESGAHARPADLEWFRDLRDQCTAAGVAYLHKQNGGRTADHGGRDLDGRTYDGYPAAVEVTP